MRFGIHIPPFGPFADIRVLADLAAEAESAGWDGFFLWDDVTFAPVIPVADPWIALAGIALRTQRMRLGPLVTPLARRRPWKVAHEAVTLDHLSGGRLILGVGVGGGAREFDNLGEARDAKVRAAMLEEGLQILTDVWSGEPFQFEGAHYHIQSAQFSPIPVQRPRIPVWVAGGWPTTAPFRRAARWDGVFPLDTRVGDVEMMPPGEIERMLTFMAPYRTSDTTMAEPFAVVHLGSASGDDGERDRAVVATYEAAGVTWWLENLMPLRWGGSWENWPVDQMRHRIRQGPPSGHASAANRPT